MNPFQSLREYELFVYTLSQQFARIHSSTLTIKQTGRFFGELDGELQLNDDYRLSVYELLILTGPLILIDAYSYDARKGNHKLYWYDSQPHPHIPELASTDPHHKHIPPNIKRNRIPAPDIRFDRPNLPFLIQELTILIDQTASK